MKISPPLDVEYFLARENKDMVVSIANQVGESARQLATAWLNGTFYMLKCRESSSSGHVVAVSPSQSSDELLRTADVARILKVSKSQAYNLINRREISSVCFGKTRRVRRADLDAFIMAHLIPAQ